jgi:hypothetical protein
LQPETSDAFEKIDVGFVPTGKVIDESFEKLDSGVDKITREITLSPPHQLSQKGRT